jgi:hypothetical protein
MTDAYLRHRQWYTDKSKTYQMVAADTSTQLAALVAVKSANHQLFIQRIMLTPTTYSQKNIKWQDTANTPVPIGEIACPAAAPETGGYSGEHLLDFGPAGVALSAGKSLDGIVSAAGIAGIIRIEAYERIVSGALNTGTVASGN